MKTSALNIPLFKRYYKELTALSNDLSIPSGDFISAILRLPNVVGAEEGTVEEGEWLIVKKGLKEAIQVFNKYRRDEGLAMENDLRLRIQNIQNYLVQIPPFEKERITKLRQRLMKNLEENFSKEKVDENRFEQEVIYYLEKMDITEEKVRLEQHCKYFFGANRCQNPSKRQKTELHRTRDR